LPERPERILDFGCGSGLFTRQLAQRFGPGVVVGSDFHYAPPAELDADSYVPMAELGKFEGTFDLVLAMHVLEHDDDALGLLARIAAMAKPGGTVVVEVPNVECVWTQVMGRAWDAWYVPFHRTHFSCKSLLAVMEAGCLVVSAVHSVTVPTIGRSLANLMHAKNGLPFVLAGMVLHPVQWAGEKLSGRSSAIRVIARIAD
jgi:2-polyprenyl-3-methyl-5-hydroxy-6-metoxy-1,4-benzoquinol methylase